VIGRTLAGRASFKDLQDCLRLHLPAPFSTVTLLTRGYFKVLFENEEGAKATRKLGAVEWSGWALSFSRYSALFRSNEHGAETLLTHSIKIQFPDLHVQLRTEKALTIMANSIGEVLDIESPDSYIKRLAGPMVTIEVKDISKLAGIIRIPSMAEGAGPGGTTTQRILYSGLPNQCRKCRRFGHLAKNYPLNKPPTQPSGTPAKAPSEWGGRTTQGRNFSARRGITERTKGPVPQRRDRGAHSNKEHPNKGKGTDRKLLSSENPQYSTGKAFDPDGEEEKGKRPALPPTTTHTSDLDMKMSDLDCTVSPSHRLTSEHQDSFTFSTQDFAPRTRLSFSNPGIVNTSGNGNVTNLNPFEGEEIRTDLLHGQREDLGEGWTFQGKRRLPVKLLSPRQDPEEALTHSPHLTSTSGGKRGLTHSELHRSYFESLGISAPLNQEFCKARIWPVLSREKDGKN
jgi:hypothetical protein